MIIWHEFGTGDLPFAKYFFDGQMTNGVYHIYPMDGPNQWTN